MINNIFKKTKIVCTIGPASEKPEVLEQLILNGMNIARLNFSHGDYAEHLAKINTIRALEKKLNILIPIMLDTKGPEIRTHKFEGGSASIVTGQTIRICMNEILGNNEKFSVTFPDLYDDVKVGDRIKLDDGNLTLKVTGKDEATREIICEALNHHVIRDRRGINCPDTHLSLPFISDRDYKDLVWGCVQGVDYVSASFVRTADDVNEIRKILKEHGGEHIKIISKVENTESVANLDAVINASDGLMVASGEYPVEAVSMQAKISSRMEEFLNYEAMAQEAYDTSAKTLNDAIANSVANTALLLNAKLIVCFSETGSTARRMSKARPVCPVIEVSNNRAACISGMMSWGVYPKYVKIVPQFIEEMEVLAIHLARVYNIPAGSKIIITGGTPVGAGKTNFMKVITLDEVKEDIDA